MARSLKLPVRAIRARHITLFALSSTALMAPATAWADCSTSGTTVTCSGTSAAYTNTASSLTVNVASGAAVTAPLVFGGGTTSSPATLTNAGTITNTSAVYGVQFGDNAQITNTGTITSTSSTTGAGAISVGANSTVTNKAIMTAYTGTPLINFGVNGTFINTTDATAAVTGYINYGTNTGTNRGSFSNTNTTYGFVGSVYASGNITAYNSGIYTGTFAQTAASTTSSTPNSVSFTNDFGGTFTGTFVSGDKTTYTNAGTTYFYSGSAIGSYYTTGGTSLLTNNNTTVNSDGTITNSNLWVGYAASPALLKVYGSYVQGANGTLNIPIIPAGSATVAAGTTYSQLYTTGTATLSGTLNLNVTAGFYKTGTLFKVIHADGGITGDFSNITVNTGTSLLFTTFTKVGTVTDSTGAADYEFVAKHNSYDTVMAANGANSNQLAIAKALGHTDGTVAGTTGLLATATADTGSDAATLLGYVDILGADDAKLFLNQISPEPYLAYAQALHDQANTFTRLVDMRMQDQNSNHPEDGWWLNITGQGTFKSVYGTEKTRDQLFGFTGGYDFSGPNHVYGAAFHISWDKLTYGAGNMSGTNRDYAVALYGSQNVGPLRLSGQLAYNAGHISANKIITIGSYAPTAAASASESLAKVNGEITLPLTIKNWSLAPFAGVDFAKGSISSFTETGAGAANLTVGKINADRTDLLAGVTISRNKGQWRPYLRAMYRNALTTGTNTVTAYLNGDSSTSFTVTGLTQGKSEVDLNTGVNIVFDDAGALFFGYQGTYRNDYKSHGINMGIRLEF
jgi:uncharacterized protein with beta-barrel porin domain